MVRAMDQFWDHVQKTDVGLKCKFCELIFAGGTSVSRIKLHFSGVKGLGISICKEVPDDVKEAAYSAIQVSNKRLKIMPSISNNEVSNRISNFIGKEVVERRTFSHAPVENGIDSISREEIELIEQGRFPDGLILDAHETRGNMLLTTKLVGQAFERNMYEIWSLLVKDDVLSIGIYGMGGVGKTALVRHIYNKLLESPSISHHVYWVTMSPDFSVQKLQNAIAKIVNLDLSNEDDESKKAAKLSELLIRKRKPILILDDVWNYIPLERVGIPVCLNGCKLVLTTRSLDVCRKTGCRKNIKLDPLSEKEEWDLFMEKLELETTLPQEVEGIARFVARECAGLPLGIVTMATSMRGVVEICEWRNALEDLKRSILSQDNEEIFQILKRSYDYLNDSSLQQFFLYCALYPKDCKIEREDLIEYLIVEGTMKGMESRQAELDKGYTILNKLENVCLLDSVGDTFNNNRYVKMHHLIRNLAFQILRMNSPTMVEAGKQLKELPDEEKWTEDLVRVSLMQNEIKEISSNHSPGCPNISTLLLCSNNKLESIAYSFFEQLRGLKVLDLSDTAIEKLPGSISYLVNLTALFLRQCKKLRHVPSLAKLKALKKLDLSSTGLEEVPHGMELLSNLRSLNLYQTRVKVFPTGLLPKLSHLQFLRVAFSEEKFITIKGEELACLRKLETLECHFYDLFDFNKYLRSRKGTHKFSTMNSDKESQFLSNYNFQIGQTDNYGELLVAFYCYKELEHYISKEVWLYNCSIGEEEGFLELPEDIQDLAIVRCQYMRSLCNFSPLKYAAELKSILILECNAIECLILFSRFAYDILDCLETITLGHLENFHVLISTEGAAPLPLPSNGIFSHLKIFKICKCPSMKKLFPLGLLLNLQNLEVIEVYCCDEIEEIIAMDEEGGGGGGGEGAGIMCGESNSNSRCHSIVNGIEFNLPKLKVFSLRDLPELKSICYGKIICNSLQQIKVWDCPKLKRMPLSLFLLNKDQPSPLPALERINIRPKEWWESLEWDHPKAKNVILPFCYFSKQ